MASPAARHRNWIWFLGSQDGVELRTRQAGQIAVIWRRAARTGGNHRPSSLMYGSYGGSPNDSISNARGEKLEADAWLAYDRPPAVCGHDASEMADVTPPTAQDDRRLWPGVRIAWVVGHDRVR